MNLITFAQTMTGELDKAVVSKPVTGFFADNALRSRFVGAKTVLIPEMEMSGLGDYDRDTGFVKGSLFSIGGTPIPNYVLFAIVLTAVMWFVWNKTTFGKNMFALGSNEEAARVSGVNVFGVTVGVFALAGAMYGFTGFIEGARIGSNTANTGLNYELDAIAACVIGGVSFVGGIGKIRGIVIGVVMLRLIFVGLTMVGVPQDLQYLIKGAIILFACALDMRKYLVKK